MTIWKQICNLCCFGPTRGTNVPRLKNILKLDFLKCPKFTQFYGFLTFILFLHGWRNFWNLTFWNAPNLVNFTAFWHTLYWHTLYFTMVEETFKLWYSEISQIGSILPLSNIHYISPWLKKNLKFDLLKYPKFTQFYRFLTFIILSYFCKIWSFLNSFQTKNA